MIDPDRQGRISKMFVWGAGLVVSGLLLFMFLFVVGFMAAIMGGRAGPIVAFTLALCLLMVPVGLVMILVAAFQAFIIPRKMAASSELAEVGSCLILSKFAIDRNGLMQFPVDLDDDLVQDQRFKLYVRVEFPDGRRGEFRTSLPTYQTIGEGMRGAVRIQGDWLGQFTPEARRHER